MDFSREFTLSPNIIEKDYVLDWVLAGISSHSELGQSWIFKGGTCLRKCYFETYRFSEDLDFTVPKKDHINQEYLANAFREVAGWIYDMTGIEIPADLVRFEIYENPRGSLSSQGKIAYRGPLQPRHDPPRIKLDLTSDEVLIRDPVIREIHHPYSDRPEKGISIKCYDFEEIFAEKIRALGERGRPRDLYDVVHLYRHDSINPDRAVLLDVLEKKCRFKGIGVPTLESLENQPEHAELEAEWENMLGHQLPALPPFDQFWHELPVVFDWLYRSFEKTVFPPMPITDKENIDSTWHPPAMAQAWHREIPLETIRFTAANRLCVNLRYQDRYRLIEPYSLRRTLDGNLLLYAVKHISGEIRSYRVDRIQGAEISKEPFIPRYIIELSTSGPIPAPTRTAGTEISRSRLGVIRSNHGQTYILECPYCKKRFIRKEKDTHLNPHKDKNGYQCYGKMGYIVGIRN